MRIDLVQVPTSDGLLLPAGFFAPTGGGTGGIDAILISVGPFHQPFATTPAAGFAAAGYPTLTLSTRGATNVWSLPGAKGLVGAAYEHFPDCIIDFDAAMDWLVSQGYQRIALFGHSIVGAKVIYYAATRPHPNLAAVISSAGIRVSGAAIAASEYGEAFARDRARAEAIVDSPHELFIMTALTGPNPMSGRAFLDRYCREDYDITMLAANVQVPILRVDPEHDLTPGTVYGLMNIGVADAMFAVAPPNPKHRAVVIPDRDHVYSKGQEPLIAAVVDWLATL